MKPYKLPRWFFLVFLAVLLLLIGGGTWFFIAERDLLQKNTENELLTIAQSKVDQISAWRKNQIAEGHELTSSEFFIKGVADWQVSGNPDNTQMILSRLKSLQDHYGYFDALLVSPQGQPLLSLNNDLTPLDSGTLSILNNALVSGESQLTDLHLNKKVQIPQISVVAPLIDQSAGKPIPIGAVILISDARDYLYPLIQSWPTASKTAETLLVERDGENVLFLTELLYQKDTAFKLRFSLTETQLPAVKAVLGETGVFTGNDYRGVEVLSVLMPVPDSPWFMVAKVDTSEALAVWRTSAGLIIALMLGFLGTAAGTAIMFWQRDEKRHYFNLAAAKAAHRESEERHLVTLMSVGDGVIVTDRDGKIQLINPVAEALTGWSQAESRGKALGKVFHIINEETQKVVENPVAKVIREGLVIGLANHTLLVARDGSRRPIADSGAPIRNEKGEISGVVLVFRDQTEERASLRELVESEKKFRTYFDSTPIAITLYNKEGKYLTVNPAYCEMLGYSQKEIIGKKVSDFTHPDDQDAYSNRLHRMLSGEKSSYTIEKRILRKDGSAIWVEGNTNLIRDEAGKPLFFLSNMTNITDRKKIEEKLSESEEKFRRYFEDAAIGISLTETSGQLKNVNQAFCDMIGYSHQELSAKGFAEITHPDDVAESKDALKGLLAGKRPAYRFEKRYIRKDGSLLWADVSTTLIKDANGKPLNLVTSIIDITNRKSIEKQLVESEQKFRLYFESSASSISLIQPDGKYIMVNPAFCDMLGYTKDEVIGKKYSDFTHPDDLDNNFDRVSRMLSGEMSSVSVEKRIVRKDGNPVWVRGNTSLVRDEEGKPQFFLANMVDISERRLAEEELRETRDYLDNLIGYANAPIITWDPGLKITRFNQAFEHLTGYSANEAVGQTLGMLFPEDSHDESISKIARALEGEYWESVEIPIRCKNGEIRIALWNSANIYGPDDVTLIATIAQGQDITERKLAEEELRNSEDLLKKAQQVAHVGSWVWHVKSDKLDWSDEMYTIFGIEKDSFTGNLNDVINRAIHPADREKVEKANLSVSEEGKPMPLEYRVVWPDGTERVVWAEGGGLVLDAAGKPESLAGIVQDITEFKNAEEEIRKLNSELEQRVIERTRELKEAQEKILRQERLTVLGQLAGGVSHELRNPLGVISNSIYFLGKLMPQADEKTTEYLGIIDSETRRAEKIITDLLDYSRIKSPEREPVDINGLVVKTLKRYPPPGNISVEISMPEFHPKVLADAMQISQVLGNLIENACQAMPDGGTLSLSGDIRIIKNDSYFAIAVKDTGAGISSKNIKHLFEPLYTTKQRGIGLGLAISKNLIESNGGWIEASSQAGKGSVFTFGLLIDSEPSIRGKNDRKKETGD